MPQNKNIMQLKIVTNNGVYRFDQRGQAIQTITEPYVHADLFTRLDVTALYDQNEEHLVHAFLYEGDKIVGISKDAVDAIQNFFLAEGAWYLQELCPPTQDQNPEAPVSESNEQPAHRCQCSPTGCPNNGNGCACQSGSTIAETSSLFVPDQAQFAILREIQLMAEVVRQIRPEEVSWDRELQKRLLSMQHCGTDDFEKAYPEAEARLKQLKEKAKAAGIPERTIELNTTAVEIPTGDIEDEEGEDCGDDRN
jgi:hypothetical protein